MKSSQSISKPAIITTPNDTEIRIERTFDAPRDVVFRAYTDPKLLAQWMGPRKYKMTIEQMDVHPGGRWHFTHIDTDGTKYGFHGEFREIVRPERIV
ncbi:MAG TPA: SRPBCC domain-containing protein, partial [Candidatus Bathyarchaeia archaeon]